MLDKDVKRVVVSSNTQIIKHVNDSYFIFDVSSGYFILKLLSKLLLTLHAFKCNSMLIPLFKMVEN